MKIYKYSEARQNFSTVLNTALKEEVIITRKDGNRFKLISINEPPQGKLEPKVRRTFGSIGIKPDFRMSLRGASPAVSET
jgi:hypothetical protein